jgi:hypothetical protein
VAAGTPNIVLRRRIETAIRVLAPVLDLMLAAGDRISRVLEREDPGYTLARMQHEGESAPRGLRLRH